VDVAVFIVWAILAVLACLVGLLGCVLPILPGTPLSWAGLFVVWAARGFDARSFSDTTVWVLLGVTAVVTALDFVAPTIGARRYGATRWGTWGSVVGMLVGAFMFPPFGMILGAFVGALAAELLGGQATRPALRASWGTFVGTMLGTFVKVAASGVILWYVLVEVFA
jgi:uncharacterized protein YqgC (DUF456 family)